MTIQHDGMTFDVPADSIDRLASALGDKPRIPTVSVRRGVAQAIGGGGTGFVTASLGTDDTTFQIGCVCLENHQVGDQLMVLSAGGDLICIGGLGGSRGRIRLPAVTDVSLVSTAHPFQIGTDGGVNLRLDTNEVQAVNNGAAAALYLNNNGGAVNIATAGALTTITGALKNHENGLVSTSATAAVTVNLTAGRFSSTPTVVATVRANTYTNTTCRVANVGNESTSSFTIFANSITGGTISGFAGSVAWFANGMV